MTERLRGLRRAQKTVSAEIGVDVIADDLSGVINPSRHRHDGARIHDVRERSVPQAQEAVRNHQRTGRRQAVGSHDLTAIVDGVSLGPDRAGNVEADKYSVAFEPEVAV